LADGSNKIDNGWLKTGTGNGIDADTVDGNHASYLLARANHSGTQAASTISDFDTQVRTSRLDQMAVPTASVSLNSQKITNLAAPSASTDAVNKDYVDNNSQGIRPKASVVAASIGNLTLSGAQTIDGVSVVAGNRVLVKDQTNPEENGVYVAASGAWSRATDTDTWNELIGAYTFVSGGSTNASSGWTANIAAGGTLGVTAVPWTQFSQAGSVSAANVGTGALGVFKQKNGTSFEFYSIDDTTSVDVIKTGDVLTFAVLPAGINMNNLGGGPLSVANGGTNATTASAARTNLGATTKYAALVGNGADTEFTLTHALNTLDVIVQVRKNSAPRSVVEPDIEIIDVNNVKVSFNLAPSTDQYRVVIVG
jgi:hypothetical protein